MIKEKEEVWKEVPGYENYMASSRGRMKSIKFNKERLLKQALMKNGYLKVNLCKEGKQKNFKVHVLVAMAFLGHTPCGHKIVVDHVDGNRLNNNLNNLRLVTQRENLSRQGGSSEHTGVNWCKHVKKWRAYIYTDGKLKHLGYFTNEVEASEAYQKALVKIL